jgi:AcrR family transcriptional regulator
MPRPYQMTTRAAAKERTRLMILESAFERFSDSWFDEVTIADIARAAGVSQQTVVNHFGNKTSLYLSGVSEIVAPRIRELRSRVAVGDVAGAVDAVLAEYEEFGDGTVRTEALALRDPELEQVVTEGRKFHRAWVRQIFQPQLSGRPRAERERLLTLLSLTLDAATWHRLRRGAGLGPIQTRGHLLTLVHALLAADGASVGP